MRCSECGGDFGCLTSCDGGPLLCYSCAGLRKASRIPGNDQPMAEWCKALERRVAELEKKSASMIEEWREQGVEIE